MRTLLELFDHVGENARYPTVCERCTEALAEIRGFHGPSIQRHLATSGTAFWMCAFTIEAVYLLGGAKARWRKS